MLIDPGLFNSIVLYATAFSAAFVSALWLSLLIWTYRDIRRRSRDPLARVLAVLVVAILFLPGVLVYWILRPGKTLEEEFQQSLEEESLLQSIEEHAVCPGCGRRVQEAWVACPNCYTRLKKACHQCGKPMELAWNLCPYCATPAPGMQRETRTIDDALRNLPLDDPEDEALAETTQPAADTDISL